MRPARTLLLGLGLLASTQGCATLQCTQGVCDCNPPPVASVLKPPPQPAPMSSVAFIGTAPTQTVQPPTQSPEQLPGQPKPADSK